MKKSCPKCKSELFSTDGYFRCKNFPINCDFTEKNDVIDYSNSKYIVFDLETTGRSSKSDFITEIAAVKIENHKIIDSYHSYIKPAKLVPAQITALTGISNKLLENEREESVVIKEFMDWAKENFDFDYVVAHNGATFDCKFILEACRRSKVSNSFTTVVDTLKIAKEVLGKDKVANNQQTTLAEYYGITYDAHRADEDVRALAEIFKHLIVNVDKDYRIYL